MVLWSPKGNLAINVEVGTVFVSAFMKTGKINALVRLYTVERCCFFFPFRIARKSSCRFPQ